jgi:cytidine deaminase
LPIIDDSVVEELVQHALQAYALSYSPYSNFPVGAALLTRSGRVITGCNIENASYGLTVCAERVAIWKAVSEGETEFVALAVVTGTGGSPCGACRQVMAEFAPLMPVVIADSTGGRRVTTVSDLLPDAFLPGHFLS